MKWLLSAVHNFLQTEQIPDDEDMLSIPLKGGGQVVLIRPTGQSYKDTFLIKYQTIKQSEETYKLSFRLLRTSTSIADVLSFLQTQPISDDIDRQSFASFHHPQRRESIVRVPKPLPPWWGEINGLERDYQKSDYCSIPVQGITNATMMRYIHPSCTQYVLLLGEDHDEDGNFVQFLEALLQAGSCPVDIIVEKEYKRSVARYNGRQVFSHRYWKSKRSHLYYLREDMDQCTSRSEKFTVQREFVEKCILPFQGRVRFWSEDLRLSDDFIFLQFLSVDLNREMSLIQREYRKEFFDCLTDFSLYAENKDHYATAMDRLLEKVEDLVRRVFEKVEFQGSVQQTRRRGLFAGVPLATVKDWMELIARSDEEYRSRFAALFDIPACERVLRLLDEQKNRLIVIFTGAKHTAKLVQMLTHDGLQPVKTYRRPSSIMVPRVALSGRTPWMQLYQKMMQKK